MDNAEIETRYYRANLYATLTGCRHADLVALTLSLSLSLCALKKVSTNFSSTVRYNGINLAFLDCAASTDRDVKPRGTVLLVHGFPQTSYQWRMTMPALNAYGYRVIAPDYRGAGESSKPVGGYSKASMAADLILLLDTKDIDEKVHVVGHDMGGTVAYMLASRWPDRVASLCIVESWLPGTETAHEEFCKHPPRYFHHLFHAIDNLPEALIMGREKTYIEYFFNKLCYRIGAFPPSVIQRYASAYAQPGAFRCALDLFRAFDKDAEDIGDWLNQHGKTTMPTLVVHGDNSSYADFITRMTLEVVSERTLRTEVIPDAAHFPAEENPRQFTESLLGFFRDIGVM